MAKQQDNVSPGGGGHPFKKHKRNEKKKPRGMKTPLLNEEAERLGITPSKAAAKDALMKSKPRAGKAIEARNKEIEAEIEKQMRGRKKKK